MQIVTTSELKAKIDAGEDFTLVMTMDEAAFRRARIPGSIWLAGADGMTQLNDTGAQIVVYCSSPECFASWFAYRQLERAGYRNIWHYTGGLAAWDAEGLPLERGSEELGP